MSANLPRRYRRIPTEILAVEFQRDADLPLGIVLERMHDEEGVSFRVWNDLHRSFVGVKPGDFLRVDDLNDVYPIDRATFEATYEEVE